MLLTTISVLGESHFSRDMKIVHIFSVITLP
jgi:hypothetical protein